MLTKFDLFKMNAFNISNKISFYFREKSTTTRMLSNFSSILLIKSCKERNSTSFVGFPTQRWDGYVI